MAKNIEYMTLDKAIKIVKKNKIGNIRNLGMLDSYEHYHYESGRFTWITCDLHKTYQNDVTIKEIKNHAKSYDKINNENWYIA